VRLSKLNQLIHTYDINNASLSIIYFNDKEYKVTNIQKFKLFLTDIKSLHLYRDELNRLFNSSLYKTTNDELYIQKKEANEIQAIAKYLIDSFKALSKVLPQIEGPKTEAYFVYPQSLRNMARVIAFRNFLYSKVSKWEF